MKTGKHDDHRHDGGRGDRAPVVAAAPQPPERRHEEPGVSHQQEDVDAVVAEQSACTAITAPSTAPRRGDGRSARRWKASIVNGMPAVISSWMCGRCAKTNGQYAKQTPARMRRGDRRSDGARGSRCRSATTRMRAARRSCARHTGSASPSRPESRGARRRGCFRSTRGFRDGDRNVRVVDVPGIGDQRPRDPGDVPDRKLSVGGVDAADVAKVRGDRIREADGQQRADAENGNGLARFASPHRVGWAFTAVNVISTPRFRESREAGSAGVE